MSNSTVCIFIGSLTCSLILLNLFWRDEVESFTVREVSLVVSRFCKYRVEWSLAWGPEGNTYSGQFPVSVNNLLITTWFTRSRTKTTYTNMTSVLQKISAQEDKITNNIACKTFLTKPFKSFCLPVAISLYYITNIGQSQSSSRIKSLDINQISKSYMYLPLYTTTPFWDIY